MDDVEMIAAGGQPAWEKTYDHPKHGPLTFRVPKLPTAAGWLAQSAEQDNIVAEAGLMVPPSVGTYLLAAALAGMKTIIECPVIDERRVEDPEIPGHFHVTSVRYDPRQEEDIAFVKQVWDDFFNWRNGLLEKADAVSKS